MASPLNSGKQPVTLAPHGAPGARVSKIRRDPPPVARKTVIPDRDHRHSRTVPIGILAFALAIVIIVIGIGSFAGWSPSQYTLVVKDSGGL
jgi:hypothetical protein